MKPILTIEGHSLKDALSALSPAGKESLLAEMVEILRGENWILTRQREWETPPEFLGRLGICHQTLLRKLADRRCPFVDLIRARGKKGRIKFIASNDLFDQFCREGKDTLLTPGRLARRMGVPVGTIRALLAHPNMPPVSGNRDSKTGRLLSFAANADFSKWLLAELSKAHPIVK